MAACEYYLNADGLRVVNLDKLTYAGNPETLAPLSDNPNHVFVQGDIGDRDLVARLLREHRPDAIVHFAAESHVDRSIDGPAAFVQTNVVGTLTLLEAARDYWRELEGEARDGLPLPARVHRRGLRLAGRRRQVHRGHAVRAQLALLGLQGGLRPPGARLPPHLRPAGPDHQLLQQLRPLPVSREADPADPAQGPGRRSRCRSTATAGNVRDWLYVGDHCAAIRRVLEAGRVGETYNVGGNAERENLTVVKTLCALLDERQPLADGRPRESLITFVADRPGHDRRYAIDASKLDNELGWTPGESFESGMRRTVDWYLAHQAWVQHVLDGSYRMQRLGEGEAA